MPITAADLKIFPSLKMNDEADAGGRRGSTAIQTGIENNVFPDPSADDRLQGRTRLRKVYPSVVSTDGSALTGASAVLNETPSDALIRAALLAYGDDNTTRQQLVDNALPTSSSGAVIAANGSSVTLTASGTITGGSATVNVAADAARATFTLTAGEWVLVNHAAGSHLSAVVSVTIPSGANGAITVVLAEAVPSSVGAGVACTLGTHKVTFLSSNRVYGVATTRADANSGATTVDLARSVAQLVPDGAVYPTNDLGIPPNGLGTARGRAPVLKSGDLATLWNEQATAPATAVNGGTVNVGRTNLSQLAVVGANGLEIARFLADGPSVTGVGCSADLAAGTVTFSDVTGYSQPVSVRHRIEERVQLATVTPLQATLGAALSRTFPAGSFLASEVPLGDLQATVGAQFSQQAWTKTWADTVIGSPVGALYTGTIGVENDGAESDRWACIFTSTTQFRLESERRGVIGTGNIGTDYLPLNPATGQPFVTLFAAGWVASGIAIGNVFRFNTTGAYGRVWMLECVSPGAAGGDSRAMLRMRGSVNA